MKVTGCSTALSVLMIPLAMASMGGGCEFEGGGFPIFFPPPVVTPPPVILPDFVDIELEELTFDPVDPGLYIDGLLVPDPLFGIETYECYAGMTIQTDALLLVPGGVIPSDTPPFVLEEGFDFLCGDIVSFRFVDNGFDPFFTRIEVNGVLIAD